MIETYVIYIDGKPFQIFRGTQGTLNDWFDALPSGTEYIVTNDDIAGLHNAPAYDASQVSVKP